MAHAFKLRISLCLLPCLYCLSLFSLFLNWRNVLNFLHGPCLWVESITNLLSVCVLSCFIVSWLLSLLKLEECIKLLSWLMPLSREYQLSAVLRYYPLLSSLLKLEECIKLLSRPMPLSREYYLFYCPYVYCPALLSPDYSLFLNWKNVLNFFHGPMPLSREYQLSAVRLLLSLAPPLFLNWRNVIKLLSWPVPSNWEYYPINCYLLLLPSHFSLSS